jgi:hypothetical protein
MDTAEGAKHATTKVDFRAFVAVAPDATAEEKCAVSRACAGAARGSDGVRPMTI